MKEEKGKIEETTPAPRQHNQSHLIFYGRTPAYCVSCNATGEGLFRPCSNPIDIEKLESVLARLEAE